jgi:thiol-disulfide isomerase/thioredoxin
MKSLFPLLCLLVVICQRAQAQPPKKGQPVHEITLPSVNGQKIPLSAFKGKLVLIDFWASWCGPCRYANRELAPLYKQYHDKGFEIYAISVDQDVAAWKQAIAADGMSWTQVLDTEHLADNWRLNYIPYSYLVDATGKVLAVHPTHKQLEKLLQSQLP